jgi:endoglucanase
MEKVPFSRGVNFSKWFESRNIADVIFTKFVEKDFENVKSLGADVIRLPIAFHNFTLSEKDHTLDPALLKYLDTAVDWAEKYKIYLIIDNHSFHPVNKTPSDIDKILLPVWRQTSEHFKDRSEYVLYEVLNEPHGISDKLWGAIQGAAIEEIRKIDKKHAIIVGGTEYNSIAKLKEIPKYKDSNIIYTFHFYDPHIFTHQGASWNKPSLEPLCGLTFPAEKGKTPKPHESFKGTWVEEALKYYEVDAKTEKLNAALDKAADFAKERGVSVFCGEFGVYMKQCDPASRVRWYEFVCGALKERNIPWTCWDYFWGFGLFKTQERGDFKSDLNMDIIHAMGFINE